MPLFVNRPGGNGNGGVPNPITITQIESLANTRIDVQREFTVPLYISGTHKLEVYYNGVLVSPIVDYNEISSNKIQFKYDIPVSAHMTFKSTI
ncbi:hypothetical protein D3C81_1065460 [compost metagenome]